MKRREFRRNPEAQQTHKGLAPIQYENTEETSNNIHPSVTGLMDELIGIVENKDMKKFFLDKQSQLQTPEIDLVDDDKVEERAIDKKSDKNFRLRCKRIFLTYPQTDILANNFWELFRDKMEKSHKKHIELCVISREKHSSEGWHLHLYAEFKDTLETRNSQYFDIEGRHPNIAVPKDKVAVIKYVAGYTNKKKHLQKELSVHGINLEKYLREKTANTLVTVEDFINKKCSVFDWVMSNPDSNIFKIKNLITSCEYIWNEAAKSKYVGPRICFWIWGPPRTGKTSSIKNEFKNILYQKTAGTKWWDGYISQTVVLIDEVHETEDPQQTKIYSDDYVFRAEVKGGHVNVCNKYLFVTSNMDIRTCFCRYDEVHIQAIKMRFREIDVTKYMCMVDLIGEKRFNLGNAIGQSLLNRIKQGIQGDCYDGKGLI